jgi:hypothetical protein
MTLRIGRRDYVNRSTVLYYARRNATDITLYMLSFYKLTDSCAHAPGLINYEKYKTNVVRNLPLLPGDADVSGAGRFLSYCVAGPAVCGSARTLQNRRDVQS